MKIVFVLVSRLLHSFRIRADTPENSGFDTQLKGYMARYSVNEAQTAARFGVSRAQFQKLRQGKSITSTPELIHACRFFQCTIDDLITIPKDVKPPLFIIRARRIMAKQEALAAKERAATGSYLTGETTQTTPETT